MRVEADVHSSSRCECRAQREITRRAPWSLHLKTPRTTASVRVLTAHTRRKMMFQGASKLYDYATVSANRVVAP